ncbi:MAG: hypothetical protein ACR2GF_03135 [Acidimicrobiales bacterium]
MGLLAVGAVLRILTVVAYRPAMEFVQDSFDYLGDARSLTPGVIRPLGYPAFLRLLASTGHFGVVPVVQHLLGLIMAVMLYALLRRFGAWPWLAALGVAPLLLDGYQVYMEQFVLAETVFEFLVVAALVALLWRERPSVALCALAGGLLGMSALTRTVGLALLVPAFAFLVVRRVGVRRVAAFAGAAVVLLGAYAGWYRAEHGNLAFGSFDGYFLAGRVEPFADCRGAHLPVQERRLCDDRPTAARPGPDWYVWNPDSPLRSPAIAPGTDRNALAGAFARDVIANQPGAYTSTVVHDLVHYFSLVRTTGRHDGPVQTFQFRTSFTADPWQPATPPSDPHVWQWTWPGASVHYGTIVATHGFALNQVNPRLNTGVATVLRNYQRVGYTPGPLLAAALVLALASGIARLTPGQRRLWWVAGLFVGTGVVMLVVPATTASFDFRYLLPTLTVLPAGGVLGVMVLARRPQGGPATPAPAALADPVDPAEPPMAASDRRT